MERSSLRVLKTSQATTERPSVLKGLTKAQVMSAHVAVVSTVECELRSIALFTEQDWIEAELTRGTDEAGDFRLTRHYPPIQGSDNKPVEHNLCLPAYELDAAIAVLIDLRDRRDAALTAFASIEIPANTRDRQWAQTERMQQALAAAD
jgi:hypothetical protein